MEINRNSLFIPIISLKRCISVLDWPLSRNLLYL
jgi:hypothetical protein